MKHYHTIIIGSGTSAYHVINTLCKAGHSVAVIDERPLGGTCAIRGCQAKKYLTAYADAVDSVQKLHHKGIDSSIRTDWKQLITQKKAFTDNIPQSTESGFLEIGAHIYKGHAQFSGKTEIYITSGEHKGETLTADYIVIASGSIPQPLSIKGAEHTIDSEAFLELETLPQSIVFIGGGYISFEFAHVATRAGAQCTIIHRSERVLKQFDTDMVDVLVEASASEGMTIETNTTPLSIEKTPTGEYSITCQQSAGGNTTTKTYTAQCIVSAGGRIPLVAGLELEKADIAYSDKKGIEVNTYGQSISYSNVYAIGDVVGSTPQLATTADHEGAAVAENILHGNSKNIHIPVLPSAVFTIPNLAKVGATEEELKNKNIPYLVKTGSTVGMPSSKRIGEKHSGYKIVSNAEGHILGAHIVRHNAAEAINIFALAMQYGITSNQLKSFPWAYPTYVSDLKYMIPNV